MHPSGKVVIITGASAGIGLATAQVFSAHGARLVLAARNPEQLHMAASQIPGAHLAISTDIADPHACQRLVERTIAELESIDIIIHNAGIGLAAPIAELRREDLLSALETNLFGPLALTQAALPHMRSRAQGQLIFVSSVVGLRALPYLGGYAATKAALDRLTESLRVELRGSGIAITLMRPGTTSTGFSKRRIGQGREVRRAASHVATPDQVGRAILRAAQHEPRIAYTSRRDMLTVWAGMLLPAITDRVLADSFGWEAD